jgi:hypothetical protein
VATPPDNASHRGLPKRGFSRPISLLCKTYEAFSAGVSVSARIRSALPRVAMPSAATMMNGPSSASSTRRNRPSSGGHVPSCFRSLEHLLRYSATVPLRASSALRDPRWRQPDHTRPLRARATRSSEPSRPRASAEVWAAVHAAGGHGRRRTFAVRVPRSARESRGLARVKPAPHTPR